MGKTKIIGVVVVMIPVLILLYFVENIKGYYRFKQYCENEGGLKVYEKLDKNVGWMAEDKHSARSAAQLNYVSFVRYPDKYKKDKFYDVRYLGGHPGKKGSYSEVEPDTKSNTKYKWIITNENIPNEIRLGKQVFEVLETDTNKQLIVFKRFGYSYFDRNKTLLAAPSGVGCHDTHNLMDLINDNFKD